MNDKRRGLGRGLGALIPQSAEAAEVRAPERPVDVFFPEARPARTTRTTPEDVPSADEPPTTAVATTTKAPARRRRAPVPAYAGSTAARERPARRAGGAAPTPAAEDVRAAAEEPGTAAELLDEAAATDDAVDTDVEDGVQEDVTPDDAGAEASSGVQPDATVTTPDGLVQVPGARFAELPVTAIRPNPKQPRAVFDEDALAELVGSIREVGVLQPVVVRQAGDGYELIMGERRWRASQEAGLESVPAIIRDTEDADLLRDALLENLHRSDLNPLEEAAAYQQLLQDFGCTHDELAARIQRSRPQISNTLRLLRLPATVQRRVAAGVLSAGHARALLGLADGAAIERLAQRIVAEGLSVRAVEEIVALGGDEDRAPLRQLRPRGELVTPALDDLAGRLSDRFDTRVKVSLGRSRGKLTVEFASVDDLNRILASLAPDDPGLAAV